MSRPRGRRAPYDTPLGRAVEAALASRNEAMAPGPRSIADLARIFGVTPSRLSHVLAGRQRDTIGAERWRAALPELTDGAFRLEAGAREEGLP